MFSLEEKYLRVGLLGLMVCVFLTLKEATKLFSKVGVTF